MSHCKGCGVELSPRKPHGRERLWCSEPCRKSQYAQTCVDCGGPTSGSEGRRAEPRCFGCALRRNGEARKVWTRDALVAAIQEWEHTHGEPPRMRNWSPTGAAYIGHPEMAAEYVKGGGRWPCAHTVVEGFGSWSAGIAAAGFTPREANHAANRRQAVAA